ncbi:MAG: hypothetical protein IK080_02860 [Clostridia bacterium]|nr:hypothetical protein [Clostridia bacterium]
MLYKKNAAPVLSDDLFRSPTAEYRGTPFWAWNSTLKEAELLRQIEIFKQMGLGGFHMHVRTGMATPYLSDEFMALVKACVKKAEAEEMLAWLYDEDRWPSGAAGGLVTKDPQYRARCLLMTVTPCEENDDAEAASVDSCAEGGREGAGHLIACYDVQLDADGCLQNYRRIDPDAAAAGTKWYAYLKIHAPSAWYNHQTYLNTLDPAAVARFVAVTHDRYAETVGDAFDKTVPAIFTDEPQFTRKKLLNNAADTDDILMPWTDDLPATYAAQYDGADVMATLPELFWELPAGQVSQARYRYHDHIAERFAAAFADTCGGWCRKHGIALTGHMMEEPTLRSQTAALGETMRSYRGFDLPGIDMLCANFEFTTAKQAQSAVHQFGREGMLSELYGVTGWDYDFRGYKLHGDWQACLGVTVRVPHLSWYAMGGEAKRDYPASIHYQSPWYGEFACLEDHFARVNTAMTRGKPVVRVGVIHPVESYWLHWGPNDQTALRRESMDRDFLDLAEMLLKGSVDFNYISESLLPALCPQGGAPLQVGEMAYDVILVSGCETLRSSTLERLEAFRAAGGTLLFIGSAPTLENALPSDRGAKLCADAALIPFERSRILEALASFRTVTLRRADGRLSEDLIYQLRRDGDGRWLFISHCCEPYNKDIPRSENLRIRVQGLCTPKLYDTLTGEIRPLPCSYVQGDTVIPWTFFDYDSLLLRLEDGQAAQPGKAPEPPAFVRCELPDAVPYTLSEPNVLVLDQAEFALDDAPWQPREEILRLDNICRAAMGWPERGGHVVQPWVLEKETVTHRIRLRFTIDSTITVDAPQLALEDAEKAQLRLDGAPVANAVTGWYVDKDIKTVALPALTPGVHQLEISLPFGKTTHTEWCYLLGDFGVSCAGACCKLIPLPEKLAFGDLCGQGLPFYGGNVVYHLPVETGSRLRLTVSRYRGALLGVALDGKDAGRIICPPYALTAAVTPGSHTVDLTFFGNRYNAFGPLHLTDTRASWHGPGAWRSDGCGWSYEYVLRPLGLLAAPVPETDA